MPQPLPLSFFLAQRPPLPPGRRMAAILACLALGACALPVRGPPILPPDWLAARNMQGCEATTLAHLTGTSFIALADHRLPGDLRVLRPGQGVTRDLLPTRLNVQVDGTGTMLRMFCG